MTITTQVNVVTAQGNGATPIFSYNFLIPTADDVEVIYTDSLGNTTTLTPTQYTISGLGSDNGGTVTYPIGGPPPIASGATLTIARILPLVQDTSFSNQGALYPTAVEDALDYLTMLVQQINNVAGRALITSIVDPAGPLPLPSIVQRANQLLGFDVNGNPVAAQPASAFVSSVMAAVVGAATTAIAQQNMGLGAAAVENLGGNIVDDGSGNLTLAAGAVHPGNINAPFTNLSSGSITDLGTIASQNVNVLGSALIISFGSSASTLSPIYNVIFSGACTLNYNATSMILPGAANITTQAGDSASLIYLGGVNWEVTNYSRSGSAKGTLVNVQVLTGTGTYVRTAGAATGILYGCGAGAGGGGAAATTASQASIGSGGGSGAEGWRFNYALPATAPYVAGTAGVGVSGSAGTNGTQTSFNTSDLVCPGGTGGVGGGAVTLGTTINAQNPGSGGAQGTGGTINFGGNGGGTGIITTGTANGGCGGKATFGSGPPPIGATATGITATGFGSGGGGAANSISAGAHPGGNGAPGVIIVWEYA